MRAILVLLGIALAGCAAQGLRPGASEAEVRQAFGTPALELRDPDGTRHLAYPTGPLGTATYMAHLGADGRLRNMEQVLDDTRFNAVRPGIHSEEVLRLIGPPTEKLRFDNLRQTAWDYRFRDTWGYLAILSVMVDDQGIVAGRITQRIEPRENRF